MSKILMVITISLCFNAFDMITGIIYALKIKDLNSSKLRDGLFKKVGFILCYCLAYGLTYSSKYIDLQIPDGVIFAVCGYVILTEVVSIVENICKINPDLLPEKLTSFFRIKES